MPAIQPARLRQQAALLVEHFDQPAAFVRSLQHMLEFYADRTHRPGQAGEPAALLAAYNVPPPVIRQILLELTARAQGAPAAALALCDALWSKPYLEFRQIAAGLLGQIQPQPVDGVLLRANSWLTPGLELRLVDLVMERGLAGLHTAAPERLLDQAGAWLLSANIHSQHHAFRLLLAWAKEARLKNLPSIFRLLQPYCRQVPAALRSDLIELLLILARHSPHETAYMLIQNLQGPDNPDTPWLSRQILNQLPEDARQSLRSALHASAPHGGSSARKPG
jgi:hypothetical protein